MRAVVFDHTGPSSVLHLVDRPVPEPGPGEVRVRIVTSGVNPTDWKRRATGELDFEEVAPGQDGAGDVAALGEGVDGFEVGDRVWVFLAQHGRAFGTACEQVVLPVDRVVRLPEGASYDLGAGLGVPAVTAHRALTCAEGGPTRLTPGSMAGRTVLVAGGAGAVGNAAIQLAVWAGATVITTVSSAEKADLARAGGAHHVVNYREEDVVARVLALEPDGVDQVVEVAPAVNNDLDVQLTRVGGTIAVYADNGGESFSIKVRTTFSRNLRYQFVLLYTLAEEQLAAAAEDLTLAVALGGLRTGASAGLPLTRFPLEEMAAAHDAVEGGTVGSVVVDVLPQNS